MSNRAEAAEVVSQTGRTLLNLRELILKGGFRPGERLSELSLSERLKASRTPIRLALDRLSQEGLVEPYPSGGFIVTKFLVEDIWDAIEMRGVLEGTAVRLAAERLACPTELDTLKNLQQQMDTIPHEGLDAFAQYMDLNVAFHIEFLELAKSPMLKKAMQRVLALPFASPSAMVVARASLPNTSHLLIIGQEQHYSIIEAIERRQGTRAEAVAREHASFSRRNLESALSDKSVLERVPGSALIRFS
jgi:GntR family transcriptional regulator of vanillate catabolism